MSRAVRSVLVTGGTGRVGGALVDEARRRGWAVSAPARAEMDVTDRTRVRKVVAEVAPEVVIHCAALTHVDEAEANPGKARAVNVDGTRNVAGAAEKVGARLAYLSTDYVFGGGGDRPFRPDDPRAPVSVYGRTKAAGEDVAGELPLSLVARTSWVFGVGGRGGFPGVVLDAARAGRTLDVVTDERSRPTEAGALAGALLDLLENGAHGVVHVACRGEATRMELARAIVEAAGGGAELRPVTQAEWGARAPRPRYSVLAIDDTEERLGRAMPHWREAIRGWVEGRLAGGGGASGEPPAAEGTSGRVSGSEGSSGASSGEAASRDPSGTGEIPGERSVGEGGRP